MANLLALDIGEKRIGVAIADVSAPFPAPLITLEASEHLASEFKAILQKYAVSGVVIGYPRNQSGQPTAQTARVEHIASLLKIPDDIPVYWQDESLTSVKAEEELKRRKKPFAKSAVDALAATYILDDYIKQRAQSNSQSPETPTGKQLPQSPHKKPKPKNKKRLFIPIIGGLLFATVIFVSSVTSWYLRALSPRSASDIYTVVSITTGSSTQQIARTLEEKKVIKSAKAFTYYVKLNGINSLQAGDYRLSSKQSVKDIVQIIADGKVTTVNILVSPGLRLDQIKAALINDGYAARDIDAALLAVRDHPLIKDLPAATKLEGYLFPDTYRIGPATTVEELLRMMLDNFQSKITPAMMAGIKAQGLTLNQAIILASIVQKEVRDPKIQPTVAQVFIKRLNQGMVLGSDVTYMYVGAVTGRQVDPSLNSPYNTRRFSGLPPTPISNFNLTALEAVSDPSKTDYLYFVAGDDGKTYFSYTLDEHESAVNKYCTKLCN